MKAEHILPDFQRALDRFDEAMQLDPIDDIHRAGCIQYLVLKMPWASIPDSPHFVSHFSSSINSSKNYCWIHKHKLGGHLWGQAKIVRTQCHRGHYSGGLSGRAEA